ncbi:thermitase, putative [Perkinsus marinus ATCC 50983]|uniref:subtilisin n=1 Tax=Perkinsus marinus (strain ATCC 50983 / TXsc) TaxID=423536 RepID=C5LQW8_PERM5|nr:thermitase, putative [Perkinsus marinus ATCC 50983]EER00853.1 thermitase, putative [Perkinsus marinus ATCC 50983]|eukprot:XP_002768135.1 thermitase, putative [Perkinsus marinus ATCC 50983]
MWDGGSPDLGGREYTDPNDPRFIDQSPYFTAISIPAAWKRLAESGRRREAVTIALIDQGLDSKHEDLQGNAITGYNVVNDNTDTAPRTPHGTQIAGILGAVTNNKIGIAGILDHVRLMPIYVTPELCYMRKAFYHIIKHRKENNVKIIVAPLATSNSCFKDMVKQASDVGILVVGPIGNDGKEIRTDVYPCAVSSSAGGVICVAATSRTGMRLDPMSSFASYVDIAAPGNNILTTSLDPLYEHVSGSSASVSIIAAIAGILYSIDSSLSPGTVKSILKETATPGVKDSTGKTSLNFGRVNADQAVARLLR